MEFSNTEARQLERIRTEIFADADSACRGLARQIADALKTRATRGQRFVLGLATGSTPVRLYRELIRLHREEGLSFANAVSFNLDEYYGLPREHPESYWRFMHEQLFDHIDQPADQIFIPDGTLPRSQIFEWCKRYEDAIAQAGGIDLQILGIGRTGHIGFNEPGSARDSRTRLVTLDARTRRDAARDFIGENNVPRYAITMGVGTILGSREVVLLAWGETKAAVVAQAVEQPASEVVPASFLQQHPNARLLIDRAAASELIRIKRPWRVGSIEWTPSLARQAVTWLSLHMKRPFLKLLDEHYGEHGMAELLTEQGPAYNLNIRVFNETQHTITGWPGGKPNADDSSRPERALPYPKNVVVFAPEPSDELLGMGGTLARLVSQGHRVTVAYLTSGSLAVADEDALSAAELITQFSQASGKPSRILKAAMRRSEARAGLRTLGVPAAAAHFLDLPFYENGRYRQFRAGAEDIQAVAQLLHRLQPQQIFVTGADADPSSVAGVSYFVIQNALSQMSSSPWWPSTRVWIYHPPERPWAVDQIDMAVPLSPDQLQQKLSAIYQHKTQRSQSPHALASQDEGWLSAERATRELAQVYDRLGLAEYEAIEAFRRASVS